MSRSTIVMTVKDQCDVSLFFSIFVRFMTTLHNNVMIDSVYNGTS